MPTYVCPSTNTYKSCLDHIWHNLECGSTSHVLKPPFSDHCPIVAIFDLEVRKTPFKFKFRDFHDSNVSKYGENISNEFSFFSPPRNSSNNYSYYLQNFLLKLLDKYFPIKKLFTEKWIKSLWITSDVLRCMRKKHLWHKLLKRNRVTAASYKLYCVTLRNLLEKYYVCKFNSMGGDMKRNWKTLNNLLEKIENAFMTNFW